MKAFVYGSMNIDMVHTLPYLPATGETLACLNYEVHIGGKGLNQAVALKKAGAETVMLGSVGTDGDFLVDFLTSNDVNTLHINRCDTPTGHAIIEVDRQGQNQMVLFRGANHANGKSYCEKALAEMSKGDLLLTQYETDSVEYITKKAHNKGVITAFNPSPFVDELKNFPYNNIDILILNEQEGKQITGKNEPENICRCLLQKNPSLKIALTLGGDGSVYADSEQYFVVPAKQVKAVDTTGAGDTFTGFFLTSLLGGDLPADAMKTATEAAAIAVTRYGAAETIPTLNDIKN